MSKALIIVDPQNDFCEGGSLAVPNSNQIFEPLNKLKSSLKFDYVIITMDWHADNHISFAKNHNLSPFATKVINGKEEVLWPVHCLQNSKGAQISQRLRHKLNGDEIYVKKGIVLDEEQYSGFGTKRHPTELKQKLNQLHVREVYVVGLALDFCVGNTALDAKEAGFKVTVVKECTKGVSQEGSKKMVKEFHKKGIQYKSIVQVF